MSLTSKAAFNRYSRNNAALRFDVSREPDRSRERIGWKSRVVFRESRRDSRIRVRDDLETPSGEGDVTENKRSTFESHISCFIEFT